MINVYVGYIVIVTVSALFAGIVVTIRLKHKKTKNILLLEKELVYMRKELAKAWDAHYRSIRKDRRL
jgi:Tfp pilus assembly protein PilN